MRLRLLMYLLQLS
jgi:hypothetical protein